MHSYAGMLAKEGITTNAIAPALIETDMIEGNSAITPDRIPIGRFGQPHEVAAIAGSTDISPAKPSTSTAAGTRPSWF
jgi:3-oxoacyl-[acyl-carrier protein] reductase